MRSTVVALAVAFGAVGGAGGQDKKAEPKYDAVKDLDKKAKAALEGVKKRGDGFVDKGIADFGEVILRADPASPAAQRIAGQAAYFQQRLFTIKENDAFRDYQLIGGEEREQKLMKVRADREVWGKAAPTNLQDTAALSRAWAQVEREWSIQDLRKK